MQRWLSESPAPVNCDKLSPCEFCGDTRVHRYVLEVLPESMNASLLAAKSSGQISYVEFRCARCRRELARVAEVYSEDEKTISRR